MVAAAVDDDDYDGGGGDDVLMAAIPPKFCMNFMSQLIFIPFLDPKSGMCCQVPYKKFCVL